MAEKQETETAPELTEAQAKALAEQVKRKQSKSADKDDLATAQRWAWGPDQVQLLRATAGKDGSDAEFAIFLEIAARYELDPFAKQIYLAKMGNKPGSPCAVIVSRDGLLAVAHRQPDFRGMVGDVVREKDNFRVVYEDGKRKVHHEWGTAKSAPDESGHPRGKIIGAWAMVHREGKESTFFYAEMDEYNTGQNVWKDKPSSMILKVPETYALRKAYSISGVVGEEEVRLERNGDGLTALPQEVNYGPNPDLAMELREKIDKARALDKTRWTMPKLHALFAEPVTEERQKEVLEMVNDALAQEQAGEPVAA